MRSEPLPDQQVSEEIQLSGASLLSDDSANVARYVTSLALALQKRGVHPRQYREVVWATVAATLPDHVQVFFRRHQRRNEPYDVPLWLLRNAVSGGPGIDVPEEVEVWLPKLRSLEVYLSSSWTIVKARGDVTIAGYLHKVADGTANAGSYHSIARHARNVLGRSNANTGRPRRLLCEVIEDFCDMHSPPHEELVMAVALLQARVNH